MAQFTKGQSGNPAGKPAGAKDKRTVLRDMLQPHAAGLINKAVEMALKGDQQMIRLCIDRIMPALKPVSEPVALSTTGNNVTEQAEEIYRAAAAGELALDEAAVLTSMLLNRARIADVDEANRNVEMALRRIEALQNDMTTLDIKRIDKQVAEEIKQKCTSCQKKRR